MLPFHILHTEKKLTKWNANTTWIWNGICRLSNIFRAKKKCETNISNNECLTFDMRNRTICFVHIFFYVILFTTDAPEFDYWVSWPRVTVVCYTSMVDWSVICLLWGVLSTFYSCLPINLWFTFCVEFFIFYYANTPNNNAMNGRRTIFAYFMVKFDMYNLHSTTRALFLLLLLWKKKKRGVRWWWFSSRLERTRYTDTTVYTCRTIEDTRKLINKFFSVFKLSTYILIYICRSWYGVRSCVGIDSMVLLFSHA